MTLRQSEYQPAVHHSDPLSSYLAEDEMNRSGKRRTHRERVFAVVEAQPGLTAGEISRLTDLERIEAARRLTDLKDAGRVVRGDATSRDGRLQCTWRLPPREPVQVRLL